MFDTRKVNANSITAIAGSMTSGIKSIKPAISLEQQARMAGRAPRKASPRKFVPSSGSYGCGSKKSFIIVKRPI
jgi:hypothetical protein